MEILLPIWVYHSLPRADYYTHNGHGVNQRLTIPYHLINLGRIRPRATFTKHYHRGEDRGIDLAQDQTNQTGRTVKRGGVRWCGRVARVM